MLNSHIFQDTENVEATPIAQKVVGEKRALKRNKASRSSTQSSGSSSSSSSSSSFSSSSSSGSDSDSSGSSDEEHVDQEGTKNGLNAVRAALEAKKQYREQKPEFLQLVRDNEKLQEELKRKQKKLLKINLDKYFLFDRLLSYEKPPPRKYVKQKNKQSAQTDANNDSINQEDINANNETLDDDIKDHKSEIKDLEENEGSLEIDVDTEEDSEKPDKISLLRQSQNTSMDSGNMQKDLKKSLERKKYKKRRKSLLLQNNDENPSSQKSIPGGTSLLLSSFSPPSVNNA